MRTYVRDFILTVDSFALTMALIQHTIAAVAEAEVGAYVTDAMPAFLRLQILGDFLGMLLFRATGRGSKTGLGVKVFAAPLQGLRLVERLREAEEQGFACVRVVWISACLSHAVTDADARGDAAVSEICNALVRLHTSCQPHFPLPRGDHAPDSSDAPMELVPACRAWPMSCIVVQESVDSLLSTLVTAEVLSANPLLQDFSPADRPRSGRRTPPEPSLDGTSLGITQPVLDMCSERVRDLRRFLVIAVTPTRGEARAPLQRIAPRTLTPGLTSETQSPGRLPHPVPDPVARAEPAEASEDATGALWYPCLQSVDARRLADLVVRLVGFNTLHRAAATARREADMAAGVCAWVRIR